MRRAALVIAALVAALAPVGAAQARAKYDVRVLAKVPPPGQPALSLVAPDRTIYVGTFTNSAGTANGPSKVFAYTPAGKLKRTYVVKGQDAGADNGVQVAAIDAKGVLYLLDQHPARVVKLNPRTGKQSTYATFKDVPTCPPPQNIGNECSAALLDNPPEPDYAAWGKDGALYVTDYTQMLIWKVAPGGGPAHVWFTNTRLDGAQFGPAGIVLMPDRRTLMLDTSAGGPTAPTPDPTTGKLYTLPIESNGNPGDLHMLWESGPKEAPDGFALSRSGKVYMALVGPQTNQLVVISPKGKELARISHDGSSGPNDVPFDEPSSVAFDGNRMIVTNDAYFSGDASHFAIFDVFAGERGAPVFVPFRHKSRGGGKKHKRKRRYSATVRPRVVRIKQPVTLHVHVFRRGHPHRGLRHAHVRVKGRGAVTGRHGRARLRVTFHHLGRHVVRVSLRGKRIAVANIRARR
jgi:hypothetical protein